MCAASADGDDVVNFCGWLATVLAGALVSVEDVCSDALPACRFLVCSCAVRPGFHFVGDTITFRPALNNFGAPLFIADPSHLKPIR